MLNKLSQSVRRRFTILRFCEILVFSLSSLSSVFVGCYYVNMDPLNGMFMCIFAVLRVSSLY